MATKIKIAIADDHTLLRKSLAKLLEDDMFIVKAQADNGKQLIELLEEHDDVQVVLMDISMPVMNGFETTEWLKKNKPHIKVLALTMSSDDKDVIRMLRSGACGYLLKDMEPLQVKNAINDAVTKGFHYSDITGKLVNSISEDPDIMKVEHVIAGLNEKELQYIRHACNDMHHKEIAERMELSIRTIDGYRDMVYDKVGVQSRVGLVIFAIKNKLIVIQ